MAMDGERAGVDEESSAGRRIFCAADAGRVNLFSGRFDLQRVSAAEDVRDFERASRSSGI